MAIYTAGFAEWTAEQFFGELKQRQVDQLIDVRLNNVSQLAGFAKKKDLEYFSLKSKKFFNEKLSKLNEIYEQHELVEKIYKFKLNALMIFNSVFKLNQDTFNNSNYSSLLC